MTTPGSLPPSRRAQIIHLTRTARALTPDTLPAYVAAKALPGVLLLVATPIMLRAFGVSAYGAFALVLASTMIAANLSVGWLQQAALRYVGHPTAHYATMPRFVIWSSYAAGIFLAIALTQFSKPDTMTVSLVAATFVFSATTVVRSLYIALLQAEGRATAVAVSEVTRAAAWLLLPLLAIMIVEPSAAALIGAASLGTILSLVPAKGYPAARHLASWTTFTVWRRYGFALSLWLFLASVLSMVDRFVIVRYLGLEAAGGYAAIYDVVVRGYAVLFFPITLALHPVISRHWNEGRHLEALVANRFAMITQTTIFIATAPIVYVTRFRWLPLVDASFAPYEALVLPLLLGCFAWQLALSAHKPLELQGRTGIMILLVGLCAFINGLLNLILVPLIGIHAAAWVTAGSGTLYLGGSAVLRRPRRGTQDA